MVVLIILGVLIGVPPEARPSTSNQDRIILRELSQNELLPEASTSQQKSIPGELPQIERTPARPAKRSGEVLANKEKALKLSQDNITRTVCHTITLLDVPRWADPRREAELRCHYAKQPLDPPLHSVKWYRGTHEIFRYTPQEYEMRAFNTSGVSVTNSSCDSFSCVITLRPEPGTAKYTCEVSSEGPRFAVDRKSTNMTLAVLPEYEPLITGLPTYVNAGEQALVNCTSDHSLPAATLEWFVDSEPQEDPVITGETHVSGADGDGLRASWRTLHVYPDDYATHRGYLALECRATLATRPPHVRSMAVRLYVESRPHISSPMLSKTNAVSKNTAGGRRSDLCVWTLLLLGWRQVPLLVKQTVSY